MSNCQHIRIASSQFHPADEKSNQTSCEDDQLNWVMERLLCQFQERQYLGLNAMDKNYYLWDKNKSQVLFGWKTGSLWFKSSWKIYNTRRGIVSNEWIYGGDDTWDHMIQCKLYHTKWNEKWINDEEKIAEYLVLTSRKRMKGVKMPLF